MLSTKSVMSPLLELGLNKYEAQLYLTLIGEGISTAKNVSDITGIPYGKVYEIISSLSSKGFCTVLPTKPMKCQAISPTDAMTTAKKNVQEKYQKIENYILKELEPMFTESKRFIEPKGIFWILNGRSNIVKKMDELIQKAKANINILCSSNGLSRLILHKEALQEAKNKGITISIAGVVGKEILEEIASLDFCDIRRIKNAENNFLSIDNKECLVVEPIPDDDNIVSGRDLGMWVSSSSYTKFMDQLFTSNFKRTRNIFHLAKG